MAAMDSRQSVMDSAALELSEFLSPLLCALRVSVVKYFSSELPGADRNQKTQSRKRPERECGEHGEDRRQLSKASAPQCAVLIGHCVSPSTDAQDAETQLNGE